MGKRGERKLPYIVYEKLILHGFKETQKKENVDLTSSCQHGWKKKENVDFTSICQHVCKKIFSTETTFLIIQKNNSQMLVTVKTMQHWHLKIWQQHLMFLTENS